MEQPSPVRPQDMGPPQSTQPLSAQGQPLTEFLRREGEPPISSDRLTLNEIITLYYGRLGTPPAQVHKLVDLKALLQCLKKGKPAVYSGCDYAQQKKIIDRTFRKKAGNKNGSGWAWTDANIGRYIAKGVTKLEDFQVAFELTDRELDMLPDGRKIFPPEHLARTKQNVIYKSAAERCSINRQCFPDRVKAEDEARLAKQSQGIPGPMSLEDQAAHNKAATDTLAMMIEARQQSGR